MVASLKSVPTDGRPHLGLRVDQETIDRLDALAEKASSPLRAVSRSDVARYALERGMDAIRAEIEAEAKARAKRAEK